MIVLALLVLYLPFHDFTPVNLDHKCWFFCIDVCWIFFCLLRRGFDLGVFCHIRNIDPNGSNLAIDETNWPNVQRMVLSEEIEDFDKERLFEFRSNKFSVLN